MNPPEQHLVSYPAPALADVGATSRTWDLLPGDVVGGFEIVAHLTGDPIMGELYEASPTRGDIPGPLALRVLRPELALDRPFRARFLREVREQREFSHPHVVPVLDGGEDGDRLFVVTPLMHAPTLERVLDAGPLAPDEALLLLAPVADALDAAHAAGLLHRGLTPASIVVPRAGRAMLTNFGLVGLAQRPARVLEYLPPEEIESSPSTEAGDRYALAAILHESLTGSRSAVPGSPAELQAIPRSGRRRPEPLPPALGSVLADALAMETWRRPASARDLINACGYALSHPEPELRFKYARQAGRVIAAAALVAAVAAALGAVTAGDGTDPTAPAAGSTTASANGIELRIPAGWDSHSGASAAIPGFETDDALVAAPPNLRGVASLVIGQRPSGGALIGSASFAAELRNAVPDSSPPDVVGLGDANAYRYSLRGPVAGRRATLYVVPTLQGAAFVGCVAQAGYAGSFLRQCERVVGSARIADDLHAIPVRDADRHDAALAAALTRLKSDRKAAFALLAGARSRATQALGASNVAGVYRRASRAIEALPAASVTKERDAGIRNALRDAATWWAVAARSARRGDREHYAQARQQTTAAQKQLLRATRNG